MPPTKSTAKWLSPQDAAKLLDVNISYISKLGRDKKLRVKKNGEGRHLYSKADVLKRAKARPPKKKAKAKATKSKPARAPVKEWLPVADAVKLCGLTSSGVQWAARKGHIRRKKSGNGYVYAGEDCKAYVRTNNGPTAKPASNGEAKKQVSARMTPKQAQTAVQKARWVFDGITMGAIVSDSEALNLLRNIFYEGTEQ
jgi:hypothetical protein